jgi:hypothetical protein
MCFLCGPCRAYIRSSEDVVQGSSVVDVLTLRVLQLFVCHRHSNRSVITNCSYDVWNYQINRVIKSGTHYLLSRYQDTRNSIFHTGWPIFSFRCISLCGTELDQQGQVKHQTEGTITSHYCMHGYGPVFQASWCRRWRYLTVKVSAATAWICCFLAFWLCNLLLCRLCATSVNILSSFSLYCCHYMFRPNRPSSGVQVVVMKESAAHCEAVLFLSEYKYFWLCGLTGCFYLVSLNNCYARFCWCVVCGCLEYSCFPYSSTWRWRRRVPPKGLIYAKMHDIKTKIQSHRYENLKPNIVRVFAIHTT